MLNVASLPSELVALPNWVLHNNKEPFHATSADPNSWRRASSTDPKTWSTFEKVNKVADFFDGIGCVITAPFVGIDFDKVRDPQTGRIEPWAVEWINKLNSYTELSPSGCGFHVWVQSDWRGGRKIGQIESYSRDRYFTVTGQQVPGSPSTINTVKAELIDEMLAFAERRKNPPAKTQHIDESESGEDNKIVRELVKELNTGDADKIERELAKRYPDRYESRNSEKGDRPTKGGKKVSYFRYTIERFFERNKDISIAHPTIDVEDDVEETLPEYPEPTNDLISECARAVIRGTTMPLGHVRESLKVIVGSMIGDGRIEYPGYRDFRVLGYHFNLGDPQSTKSKSFNEVRDQFQVFAETLNVYFKKLSSYGSKEFLVKGLSEHPHQLLYVPEGNELVTANENFPGVFSKLTDAYDEKTLTTGSFKNSQFEAKDVELASVICQTRDDFTKTFGGRSAIGGGGLARWTITFSPRIARRDWHQDMRQIEHACNQIRARVQDIRSWKVTVRESPEAKRIRLATFEDFDQLDKMKSARLDDIYRREIVLAAAFGNNLKDGIPTNAPEFMDNFPVEAEVTAEMAEFARNLTLQQYALREALWPNDAGSNVERMEIAIRNWLSKRCHQSDRSLMQAAHVYRPGSGGTEAYKRAKRALAGQGMKCTGVNRKGSALYCASDCPHGDAGWKWQ